MFSNEWFYHRTVIDAIAAAFPGVPIVVGGEHATAAGEYVLQCCPGVVACASGEGEDTLHYILHALEQGTDLATVPGLRVRTASGEIVSTGERKRVRNLDELPWPAWHLLPIATYLDAGAAHGIVGKRTMPMLASRGCPYRCTFCSNPQMWGKLWNIRSPEDVVAEMAHYKETYGADSFSFYDLTAVIRREWILDFARLLQERELNVTWLLPSGTRSEALDREVVRAMKASGCLTFNLAPESGSPDTLAMIKKQVKLDKMLQTVRVCAQEGIYIRANIIFGFPGETWKGMRETLWFIVQLAWAGLHDVGVFPFTPYPGSALHDKLRSEGVFPSDSHEYDALLASNLNSDYLNAKSWNRNLGDRQLRAMLIGGTLLFYGSQYAFRPWRLAVTLGRVARGAPVTFMERVLYSLVERTAVRLKTRALGTGNLAGQAID
jgi:anaerobic magnesium-protoporphyrin IX monomethyl ester cyclase